MENIERSVDNPPSDISQNSKLAPKKFCCNFSLKKIAFCFGFLLLAFVAFQFYQTKTLKPISCGGDWSYNVKCSFGTTCQSIEEGPLSGGLCKPYLSPLFDSFSSKSTKVDEKEKIVKETPAPILAPKDFPKIIGIKKVDTDKYIINTTTFPKSMWLCIQDDYYSKPDNKTCNSGSLFWYPKQDFYINSDNTALRLYSDSEQTQLYDEVLALDLKSDQIRIAKLSNICGNIEHNSQNGNYSIKDTRLLTKPGWQNLIPFINKEACVQGEFYPDTSSIRVYFVEEANKTTDTSTPAKIGASWKTYTNIDGKYSIKYPSDKEPQIKESVDKKNLIITMTNGDISISAKENPKRLTTKEWELERSKQSLDYYTSIKDRNIGNNIFTEIQPKTGMPYKLISDLKNERIFMIFGNITELDQILSTFQFAN